MQDKDFYKALGVNESADEDEIKRVYKKLAKKYHPDKNKGDQRAEERFKEISEAYAIIGDAEKRKKYDQLRKMGAHQFAGGDFTWDEIISRFDGGMNGTRGFGGIDDILQQMFGGGMQSRRGSDVQAGVKISFKKSLEGGKIELNVSNGMTQRKVTATIPSGIEDGNMLRLRGQGNVAPSGGTPGDLLLIVNVEEHRLFKRKGDHVLVELPLNIAQAILGSKIRIPTPYGQKVNLRIPAGTQTGRQFRIPGMGVKRHGRAGDLIVTAKIEVPEKLSAEQKEKVEALAEVFGMKH